MNEAGTAAGAGDDRDNRGRFAAGNRGGPGRPRRETEEAYRDVTIRTVTPRHWRRIVARARDDAMNGNAKAREWLSKMLGLDRPAQIEFVDADGPINFAALLASVRRASPAPEAGRPSNMLDMDEAIKRALEAD